MDIVFFASLNELLDQSLADPLPSICFQHKQIVDVSLLLVGLKWQCILYSARQESYGLFAILCHQSNLMVDTVLEVAYPAGGVRILNILIDMIDLEHLVKQMLNIADIIPRGWLNLTILHNHSVYACTIVITTLPRVCPVS